MANKDLKRNPHHVNEGSWWYEEKHGITVVAPTKTNAKLIKISWKALRKALKRKDKKNGK